MLFQQFLSLLSCIQLLFPFFYFPNFFLQIKTKIKKQTAKPGLSTVPWRLPLCLFPGIIFLCPLVTKAIAFPDDLDRFSLQQITFY